MKIKKCQTFNTFYSVMLHLELLTWKINQINEPGILSWSIEFVCQ